MSVSMVPVTPATPVSRREVGGVFVLLYPKGPYLDVAERVRAVHASGCTLRVEQGDVLQVGPGSGRWIYRATIQVGEHQYLGDAEIHLGADPTCPDGTNPISCAQTSAIGQALEFAGFGDLKSVLLRLGQPVTRASVLEEENPSREGEDPRQTIAGIQTVWLDSTPYVPVAERLYHLHQSGTSLSMERCEIVTLADIWVYRATILVGERRYLGEAEIFFNAPPGTPDATHPISCAQISAVGNALALAGFGDVRSILERLGRDVHGIDAPPLLASADAVIRARHQAQASQASHVSRAADADRRITENQRRQIAELCERLGEIPPDYATLGEDEAIQLLARLQTEQDDLFRTAHEAQEAPSAPSPASTPTPTPTQPEADSAVETEKVVEMVNASLVRQLKQRWREVFQPAGTKEEQFAAWRAFKAHVCQQTVSDEAMSPSTYDCLLAAIPEPRRSSSGTLVRQAPRIVPRLGNGRSTRT